MTSDSELLRLAAKGNEAAFLSLYQRYQNLDVSLRSAPLCSIANPLEALAQMARVMKPGGRLIFLEHGRAPDPRVVSWQDRLTPYWKRIAGGCHLNRKVDELIIGAGFQTHELKTFYQIA